MKTTTCLLLSTAATLLFGVSAQAQSWGFTLGNGAGFYFNPQGSSGSVVRHGNCGYGGGYGGGYSGGYSSGRYGPVYVAEAPVVYHRQPEALYPQQGVIVRTIPYSYNTSHRISHPNRW